MIGNPVNYDEKYKGDFPIHPIKLDSDLKRYLNLLSGNEILDLFSDFKTISIAEAYFGDQGGDTPHYSGIIKYIGQKIK